MTVSPTARRHRRRRLSRGFELRKLLRCGKVVRLDKRVELPVRLPDMQDCGRNPWSLLLLLVVVLVLAVVVVVGGVVVVGVGGGGA